MEKVGADPMVNLQGFKASSPGQGGSVCEAVMGPTPWAGIRVTPAGRTVLDRASVHTHWGYRDCEGSSIRTQIQLLSTCLHSGAESTGNEEE